MKAFSFIFLMALTTHSYLLPLWINNETQYALFCTIHPTVNQGEWVNSIPAKSKMHQPNLIAQLLGTGRPADSSKTGSFEIYVSNIISLDSRLRANLSDLDTIILSLDTEKNDLIIKIESSK